MADTDGLRPYLPRAYPALAGAEARYITEELRTISTSIASIREVLKKLEARLVAGGL